MVEQAGQVEINLTEYDILVGNFFVCIVFHKEVIDLFLVFLPPSDKEIELYRGRTVARLGISRGRTVARSGISRGPGGGSPLAEREVSSLPPIPLPPQAAIRDFATA